MTTSSTPNPAHLEVVRGLCNRAPYLQLLGIDMTVLEAGRCRLEVDVDRKHFNPFGGLCGGVFASLIDVATYWSLYAQMPADMGGTTLDLQTNFLRAVNSGRIACEAWVTKPGRSICLCQAEITDERGRLLANGMSKMFLSPDIQHVNDAVRAIDPSIDLPPKFL